MNIEKGTKKCPKCGRDIVADAVVCPYCSYRLEKKKGKMTCLTLVGMTLTVVFLCLMVSTISNASNRVAKNDGAIVMVDATATREVYTAPTNTPALTNIFTSTNTPAPTKTPRPTNTPRPTRVSIDPAVIEWAGAMMENLSIISGALEDNGRLMELASRNPALIMTDEWILGVALNLVLIELACGEIQSSEPPAAMISAVHGHLVAACEELVAGGNNLANGLDRMEPALLERAVANFERAGEHMKRGKDELEEKLGG